MIRILFSLLVFALIGCREQVEKPTQFAPGAVNETSKNFLMPKRLKSEIDREYVNYMKSLGPPYDIQSAEELLAQVPREFLDIEVTMWAKSQLTMALPRRFVLPRGGGAIDLKDYIRSPKGSFFVDIKATRTIEPDKPAEPLKVYYLSLGQKRGIGGETFGAGCGVFMDVSRYLQDVAGRGIQVNATDERYLSVLAGVYYFVSFSPERIYLAAMKIEDSRYPDLMCALDVT